MVWLSKGWFFVGKKYEEATKFYHWFVSYDKKVCRHSDGLAHKITTNWDKLKQDLRFDPKLQSCTLWYVWNGSSSIFWLGEVKPFLTIILCLQPLQ